MIIAPHILTRRGSRYVVVIRHPETEKPSALRHDVIAELGRLSGSSNLPLLWEQAQAWIARCPNQVSAPPLPGYGALDRMRWKKARFAAERCARARLIRSLRSGADRTDLVAEYGQKMLDTVLKRWKKLAANLSSPPRKKRGGSQVKTGSLASAALLRTLVLLATRLRWGATLEELQAVQSPPLAPLTVKRHLALMESCLRMRIDGRFNSYSVLDWGLLDPEKVE